MQKQSVGPATTARTSYARTYWRRSDEPSAWWPWGLLPLLGLLLLFLYGAFKIAPAIQTQTAGRVAADLAANGLEVKSLNGDGQIVNIRAVADATAENGIRAIAGIAKCDTWAGQLQCPTDINLTLDPVPMALPQSRHHDFEFSLQDSTLHLRGELPTQAAKDDLLAAANSQFADVMDHLVISNNSATSGFPFALEKALRLLGLFERGDAQWNAGVFSATGWVTTENAAVARAGFGAERSGVSLGNLTLNELQDVSTCNEQFASLLGQTSIRFRTSSAEIDASSQALLEQLADTAAECPGRILIAGHTDSMGAEEPNQRLSLARAQAVTVALANLGVPGTRLMAIGHGESEPVATNDTASGRAQNRRIVIRIIESDTE